MPRKSGVSRRGFVAALGSGAALPLVAGHQGPRPSRTYKSDVVVAGGGMSGVCAALAAARNGASVALIQDRSVLGGNSSSEVRMHIVGADHHGGRSDTDSRESGIIEELRLEDAVHNPHRSASLWDLLLYDTVRRQPAITLFLNTSCVGVRTAGPGRIAAVNCIRPSTEESFEVEGAVFLDCTGDGRVGVEAGAEFRVGREARPEFGESMAPDEADKKVLGSSILFTTRQHERAIPFRAPTWIKRFPTCADLPHRAHSSWEYGYWWVELGGDRDTVRQNEEIRDELLAVALGVWDHIKNSGAHPTSANWALEWIGFIPGKRESRRFVGDYILKQQDIEKNEEFEDAVAYGGWPLDLHPPEGIYSPDLPNTAVKVPLYSIPFRSLYSRNVNNLLFAGRNISTTHVAFGSTRVMATCSAVGQAAGTAAALCVRQRVSPRELSKGSRELQQLLLKDDAYIIGVCNEDGEDVARGARISASSEFPAAPAKDVLNGVSRGVYGKRNRWISDPAAGLPQSLEARFDGPKRLREIHLTFDTGLNRQLTLTHSDGHNAKIIRGPQPETVRDYRVELLHGETRKPVAEVRDNYQRKRVHRFEPAEATGVRVTVTATNGDKSARIFEIRAYA